jgi:O-glycosyl hydrolase
MNRAPPGHNLNKKFKMKYQMSIDKKAKLFLSLIIFQLMTAGLSGQVKTISFRVDPGKAAQTIENFGASGCWFSEGIGKYWNQEKKDSIARLLFSREFDNDGKPTGIGLSAWRFNIGGGTAEQGAKSGIKTAVKRVECFMDENGNYDWTKQAGYQWFLEKANDYKVENLIAFSNTPPVYFTQNGLGFKTEKDYTCNLREDKYDAYAEFLSRVLKHFDSTGIHFRFISPVNEPQWDWSNKFGEMNQEGTPWHNADIFKITARLDSLLRKQKLKTQILLPEAATLKHLYSEGGHAGKQIQFFTGESSPYNIKKIPSVYPVLAGHSYFTDAGDSNRVHIRRQVRDTMAAYKTRFWQSEYSMLGNGYKENKPGRIPAMDCALFLAKMIHTDLTVANAAAWQLWNVYEPGSADFDTRYYLIALQTNDSNNDGSFKVTKNLWAMGHYSRFIRPGMKRLVPERDDDLTDEQSSRDLMCSAFSDGKGKVVMVLINYTNESKTVNCRIKGSTKFRSKTIYTTTGDPEVNMKPGPIADPAEIKLQPRSINTIILSK